MAGAEPVANAQPELIRAAAAFRVALPVDALARFATYIDTLLFWRSRLSLTAATTAAEIVLDHIADAFAVVPFIRRRDRIADLGSGAGFPGVPLAIVCPEACFDLVESRRKKANFLREVVRATELGNVNVVEERAETLALHALGAYDMTISRAVWRGDEFLTVSHGLLRIGGTAIAMKGPQWTETAGPVSVFSKPEVVRYDLERSIQRALVIRRRTD